MPLSQLFQCPNCGGKLNREENLLTCEQCRKDYAKKNGIPFFVKPTETSTVEAHTAKKTWFRKLGKLLQPPHHSIYLKNLKSSHGEGKELLDFIKDKPDITILNIGSLSKDLKPLHPKIINLDISYYAHVNVVADAHSLPFKNGSIDMILFKNVLEHIKDPWKVMEEIYRVLKPEGYLYIKVPFLQPFHSVPDDYQRYTQSGMKEWHKNYRELEMGIAVGPGSMLSWIIREWLAIVTSAGNMKLYKAGLFFWGWLTFWIKYLDLFFKHNQLSHRLCSAFYGIYQKK